MSTRSNSEELIGNVVESELATQELREIAAIFLEHDRNGDQKLSFIELQQFLRSLNVSEKEISEALRPYNEWTFEKALDLMKNMNIDDDELSSRFDSLSSSSLSPEPLSLSSSSLSGRSRSSSQSRESGSENISTSGGPSPIIKETKITRKDSPSMLIVEKTGTEEKGKTALCKAPRLKKDVYVNPEHERIVLQFHQEAFIDKIYDDKFLPDRGYIMVSLPNLGEPAKRTPEDLKKMLSNVVRSEIKCSDFQSVGNEVYFRQYWKGWRDDGTTFEYDTFNKFVIENGKIMSVSKAGSGFKMEGKLSDWLAKKRRKELEAAKKKKKEKTKSEKAKEREKAKATAKEAEKLKRDQRKKDREKEKEKEKTVDQQWQEISKYLQGEKLRDLKNLPHQLHPPSKLNLTCPAFSGSATIKQINVLKRFNSRKIPHLVELISTGEEKVRFIFKEDDDISTDVAVMKLLRFANEIWKHRGAIARIRTYNVVACPDLTGFVEVVPGTTMLKVDTDSICNTCGDKPTNWESFYSSLIAVVVVTCAFDITDRHHNNVMFTPDCDISLIDLSASLGKEAPLDAALSMNPVYFPKRFRKVLDYYFLMKQAWEFTDYVKDWADMEEDAMIAYFHLHNCRMIKNILLEEHNFTMPPPDKFMNHLKMRQFDQQKREITRNVIVETMDSSTTINKIVAGITSIVPLN